MKKSIIHSFSIFSLENLFLFVCIFYSAGAISFYSSPWGYALLLLLSLFSIKKFNINVKLFIALSVWSLYCIAIVLYYGDYRLTFNHFVRFFTLIVASYALISKYGYSLFYRFEKIIVFLAKISLLFWIWMILHKNSLLYVGSIFSIGNSANNPDRMSEFYYVLLYTIEYFSYHTTLIPRNYGFCIEPASFAAFLVFTLFFNILRNDGIKAKDNSDLLILLFALLTTQSTTGIVTFMIFVMYYMLFRRGFSINKIFTFVIIFTVFIAASIYLDFLLPKIEQEYLGLKNFERLKNMSHEDMRFSAGRFGGFIIGWNDIISHPILGIGANGNRSFAHQGGASLMNTNGFAGLMSLFGLFGLTLYFYLTTKTSVFISRFYRAKIPLGLLIIFTFILFGTGIYRAVIFFAIMMYGYFIPTHIIDYPEDDKCLHNVKDHN